MPSNVLKAIITADATGLQKGVSESVQQVGSLKDAFKQLKNDGVVSVGAIEEALRQMKIALKTASDPQDIAKINQAISFLTAQGKELRRTGIEDEFQAVGRGGQRAATSLLGLGHVFGVLPNEALHLTHSFDGLLFAFEQFEAQTGSAGGALKKLGGALVGPLGIGLAISGVISLLEVFGGKLFETSAAQKALNESITESSKKFADDVVKLTSLFGLAQNNAASTKDREKALKALNEQYAPYLKNLGIEEVTLGNLKVAYDKVIDSLLKQAVVKGLQDQIAESVKKTASAIITLSVEEEKRKAKSAAAAEAQKNQLTDEDKKRKQLADGLAAYRSATNFSTDAQVRQNQVLNQGAIKAASFDERVKLLKEDLQKELAPLLNITNSFADLGEKLDTAKIATKNVVEEAKKLSSFLTKEHPELNVQFVVDPSLSEEETKKQAIDFIKKATRFIEHGTREFSFKTDPLQIFFKNFGFKFDTSAFQRDVEEKAPKTYAEAKAAFEKEIKHLAENNPIVIATNAKFEAGQKHEKNLFAAIGITPDNFNEAKGALTEIEKNAISTAKAFSDILTPAVSGFIGAIANGKNPVQAFFDGVKQAIVQLIQKLVTAAITAAIFNALLGKSSPGFGALFGKLAGFRAGGGSVDAGKSYVVGEKGPEIFTPNTGGRIIANSAMKNGLAVQGNGMHLTVGGEFVINGYNLKAIASLVNQRQNRLF